MSMLTALQIEDVATRALRRSGADARAAASLARAIAAAELDGMASHGLAYLATYCQHLECGKVNPKAFPTMEIFESAVRVDAQSGFAHPAIDIGFETLIELARSRNIASLAIFNSYNCGVLGYHTERLAEAGLVALGFTNAPASIAAWGARAPVLGTNPWSLAVPGPDGGAAIVIDQSASVIAKSEVMRHAREGKPLKPGWAFDATGNATTDAAEALKGTMAPSGGHKGVSSALMVEVFAACLSGATPGIAASPFSGTAGGPPRTGQFFIAVAPQASSGNLFHERLATVMAAFAAAEGARLPGARRQKLRAEKAGRPIHVDPVIYEKALALAGAPG